MASSKDILQAQRYNRRRLVNAFTSGTPGGREIEAPSPTRPLLVGGILAAVLVLVAVVAGRFAPALPSDWQNNTLVMVKGTGARYIAIDGVLRPVANVASARLLSDPPMKTSEVDAAALSGIPRGSAVGIPDAPDQLPPSDLLRSSVWSACSTTSGGSHGWIGRQPARLAAATSALVSNGKDAWLATNGRRFRLASDEVRFTLELDSAAVHPVDAAWLALFEPGDDLAPLVVKDSGAPANGPDVPARLGTAVVGSVVNVEEGATQRSYLFTGPNQITPLTPVALALYRIGSGSELANNPLTATVSEIAGLEVVSSTIPATWPSTVGETVPSGQNACGVLSETDQTATTALGQVPVENPDEPTGDAAGLTVAGGSGALVKTTSGGTLGATSLVTDLGVAYGIGGDTADTLSRLGYADSDVHPLPEAWLALVPPGVVLSKDAAWATVKEQ